VVEKGKMKSVKRNEAVDGVKSGNCDYDHVSEHADEARQSESRDPLWRLPGESLRLTRRVVTNG
jgi:hypothetical protein